MFVAVMAFADVTYYVSPGGDGTDPTSGDLTKVYAHPQVAIDAATGEELTTIVVEDGTYVVRTYATDTSVIDIAKSNVRLVAHNARQAIIDGQRLGPQQRHPLRLGGPAQQFRA